MTSILGSFDGVKSKKRNRDDVQYIYYKEIRPAKKNRDVGDIKDLAEDIAEDGLEHNLLLTKLDDEDYKYEIVAGHRRFMAICLNIERGDRTYEYVPAKVKNYDEIDALRRLHLNNINTKPYTPGEMMEAIEDLRKIYEIKKQKGEKEPGRIQELIAKDVGLKKSQVGNYEKVINNAVDEVKDKLKDNEITLSEALEIVEMDDENQLKFVENSDGDISLKTIKEYKEALNEIELDLDEESYNEPDDYQSYEEEYDKLNEVSTDVLNCKDEDKCSKKIYEEQIDKSKNVSSSENNNYSVSELVIGIQTSLHLLKNKINSVEWKNEYTIVEEILKLLTELKESAGI